MKYLNAKICLVATLCICVALSACRKDDADKPELDLETVTMEFDEVKWKEKKGLTYPYRDSMLADIVFNDSLRALSKADFINALGEPDRVNGDYLYYTIHRKRLGTWTLRQKSLVVLYEGDSTLVWMKIYE